jgi:hypothetical protein
MRLLFFLMLFVSAYSVSASAQFVLFTAPPTPAQVAVLVNPDRVHSIVANYFDNTHVGLDIRNLTPENKRKVLEFLKEAHTELTVGNIATESPRNPEFNIRLYTGYIHGVLDTTVNMDAGAYIRSPHGRGLGVRSIRPLDLKKVDYIFLNKETYQEMRTRLKRIIKIKECAALMSGFL